MRFRNHDGCLAFVLLLACGCDFSGTPAVATSTEEAEVKGTVRLKGKVLTNGTVLFHTANIKRSTKDVVAPIGKDGTFQAKAAVGDCTVTVDCKELNSVKNQEIRDSAEQNVTIRSGTNELDINIPPQ